MKSKRSPLIVITDDHLKVEMHFFGDGTNGLIIQCKKSDIAKLYKSSLRKMPKKFKKLSRIVHLSPEISFVIR